MTSLMAGTRTVGLGAEECRCGGRYHFIDVSTGVDVGADLGVGLYLGAGIKEGVDVDVGIKKGIVSGSFLSSSVRHCSTCCRIAVAVMIEVCRNVTSA